MVIHSLSSPQGIRQRYGHVTSVFRTDLNESTPVEPLQTDNGPGRVSIAHRDEKIMALYQFEKLRPVG